MAVLYVSFVDVNNFPCDPVQKLSAKTCENYYKLFKLKKGNFVWQYIYFCLWNINIIMLEWSCITFKGGGLRYKPDIQHFNKIRFQILRMKPAQVLPHFRVVFIGFSRLAVLL